MEPANLSRLIKSDATKPTEHYAHSEAVFSECMMMLYRNFRRSADELEFALYRGVLADLTDEELQRATERAIKKLKHFPVVAELRDFVNATSDSPPSGRQEAHQPFAAYTPILKLIYPIAAEISVELTGRPFTQLEGEPGSEAERLRSQVIAKANSVRYLRMGRDVRKWKQYTSAEMDQLEKIAGRKHSHVAELYGKRISFIWHHIPDVEILQKSQLLQDQLKAADAYERLVKWIRSNYSSPDVTPRNPERLPPRVEYCLKVAGGINAFFDAQQEYWVRKRFTEAYVKVTEELRNAGITTVPKAREHLDLPEAVQAEDD